MKKELFAKVEASKKLANEEKKKKKKLKNARVIKLLSVCKAQGEPVVPEDLDSNKLTEKSEVELRNEVRYLRAIIAPNIREKIKSSTTKKFVKLTKTELIDQIKNVLKPENDVTEKDTIENLLKSQLLNESEPTQEESEPEVKPGLVGVFQSKSGIKSLAVVLDASSLQLYVPCRYGFKCNDGTESLSDWSLITEVNDYDFIKKRGNVFLS